MRTKKKLKHPLARLQIQIPAPVNKAVRMLAVEQREYPSTTAGRLLTQALGLDPIALGIEPANGHQTSQDI